MSIDELMENGNTNRSCVPIGSIRSDYDGRVYNYPLVSGSIRFKPDEILEAVGSLGRFESDEFGLRGLHLSPLLAQSLEGNKNRYMGLEWITNIKFSSTAVENFSKIGEIPRQLKLLSADRRWDEWSFRYRGDVVLFKFSIQPYTGEFIGGDYGSGDHANHISRYGTAPFGRYVRLAYIGSRNKSRNGTLISRPYYTGGDYYPKLDRELTLRTVALLIANNLPQDTKLLLSGDRGLIQSYID